MATVKVKFRNSSREDKEGVLVYQIIHKRVARQVKSGCRLFAAEWDGHLSKVIIPMSGDRREYLLSLEQKLTHDIGRLKNIVMRLDRMEKVYTSDRVVALYNNHAEACGFVAFARELIRTLRCAGRRRTADTYSTTLNSFMRFLGGRDVLLDDLDSSLIAEYESSLKAAGISRNSSSFYMRNLRAMYNRAVEKELTGQRNPFKNVYTGICKTVKRALPLAAVRKIKNADLASCGRYELARDLFLFSLYTRGMSFVDMAYLRKKDLRNGVLSYRRHKTGQRLSIKWERCMQEIVDKYGSATSEYLLPLITSPDDEWRQYKTTSHRINRNLKDLGCLLNIPVPLTMYVARHTWASVAHSKNIPLAVISEGLGHDSEKTTRIYLAALDTAKIDRANRLILKSL